MVPEQELFFEQLYRNLFPELKIYAMRSLQNDAQAEEVVQDTFHEALQKIDILMCHKNPEAWLVLTLQNKIRNHRRSIRKNRERVLSLDVSVIEELGWADATIEAVLDKLTDVWTEVVLLDGEVLPGEAAEIRRQCPRARLHAMQGNQNVKALLASLAMDDDTLRTLYKRVRMGGTMALLQLGEDTGLTPAQVLTGLMAFHQVRLVEMSLDPYAVKLLPPQKCRMDDSALVRYLRAIH